MIRLGFKEIVYIIFHGTWSAGWEGRDTWPDKEYLWAGGGYYDGWHWGLHIYKFWLEVDYP